MRHWILRQRWLILSLSVSACTYAGLVYDAYRYTPAERHLRKAGIALSMEELTARYPSEPKEDNGAFCIFRQWNVSKARKRTIGINW